MNDDWRYRFGIEEEFFLTERQTGHIVEAMPRELFERCRARFGNRVSHELLQSQVEATTGICDHRDQALAELRALRAGIGEEAAAFDLALLSAGTHPMAEWREQTAIERPRYLRMMDDFQIVAQRNLLCGLHVHVGVPPGEDRVQLMNRSLPWLPLLLALSCSSPFWHRKRTGMMSYRQSAYDEWPRTGIPDRFDSERSYATFVARLVECHSLRDASSIWWAIRPSHRYPTLELRLCDACPDVADSVMLADVFRCLLRALRHDPALGASHDEMTRLLIEENRWRAKRYGLAAQFVDVAARRVLDARDAWDELATRLAPHADALDAVSSLARAQALFTRGTSAARQLAAYESALAAGATRPKALRVVVDGLLAETAGAAE